MKLIFIIPIRAYQYFISPILGQNCRHVPTCSDYMIKAIKEWGILQGIWLGTKRLLKCYPWGTFGYDPVPSKSGVYDKADNIEESNVMQLQFEKRGGLLPVVVQESNTDQVLMLAYADRQAFQETLTSGLATFYSTSRKEMWTKGKTSGNSLLIDKILVDCDQDAIIYKVTLNGGGVCHTFSESGDHRKACFYRELDKHGGLSFLPNMK